MFLDSLRRGDGDREGSKAPRYAAKSLLRGRASVGEEGISRDDVLGEFKIAVVMTMQVWFFAIDVRDAVICERHERQGASGNDWRGQR